MLVRVNQPLPHRAERSSMTQQILTSNSYTHTDAWWGPCVFTPGTPSVTHLWGLEIRLCILLETLGQAGISPRLQITNPCTSNMMYNSSTGCSWPGPAAALMSWFPQSVTLLSLSLSFNWMITTSTNQLLAFKNVSPLQLEFIYSPWNPSFREKFS